MIYLIRDISSIHREWHKPDWLYNSLPWLYISGGIITAARLYNLIALFSSSMLIIAGITVLYWRYGYRSLLTEETVAKEKKKGNSLVKLTWRASFNCGNKVIDQQHRNLFNKANALIDAVTTDQMHIDFNEGLRNLIKDIQIHFRDEENILEHLAPAIAASHRETHKILLQKIQSAINDMFAQKTSKHELLAFLVFDIIASHLLQDDLEWQEVLKKT
jgi:hemerythrin-like metal-binding protein